MTADLRSPLIDCPCPLVAALSRLSLVRRALESLSLILTQALPQSLTLVLIVDETVSISHVEPSFCSSHLPFGDDRAAGVRPSAPLLPMQQSWYQAWC